MKEILKSIPKKHYIVMAIADVLLTLSSFLVIPIVGEIIRSAMGGFSTGVNVLVIVAYVFTFLFTAVVSTFVVGVFYGVYRGFRLFFTGE